MIGFVCALSSALYTSIYDNAGDRANDRSTQYRFVGLFAAYSYSSTYRILSKHHYKVHCIHNRSLTEKQQKSMNIKSSNTLNCKYKF